MHKHIIIHPTQFSIPILSHHYHNSPTPPQANWADLKLNCVLPQTEGLVKRFDAAWMNRLWVIAYKMEKCMYVICAYMFVFVFGWQWTLCIGWNRCRFDHRVKYEIPLISLVGQANANVWANDINVWKRSSLELSLFLKLIDCGFNVRLLKMIITMQFFLNLW